MSYVRVPPDGVGKRILTKEHTVDGEQLQVQGVHLVSSADPSNFQYVDNKGSAYIRFAEGQPSLDPYARFKTVETRLIGVYEHSIDSYDDLYTTTAANGATCVYDNTTSSVVLTSSTVSNSNVRRQTNRYHYYQPGTSSICMLTVACGDNNKVGNTRRWGMYDDTVGVFFQLKDGVMSIVARTSITGETVDTVIPQAAWTHDKLDGTGLSGINLDPSKATRYWANFSYPGGVLRMGIFNGEERIKCFETDSFGSHYEKFSSASMPFTFENFNTQLTSGSSLLRIYGTILGCEGEPGYTFWRYGGLGCTNKTVTTNTPILSAKSKPTLPNGLLNKINSYPETLSVFCTGGSIKLHIVSHSTADNLLTNSTWTVDNGSTLLGDTGATVINTSSDNYWIMKTYYCGQGVTNIDLSTMFELNDEGILLYADGTTSSVISLVATKLDGTTVTVTCDLSTRELW